MTHEDRRKPGFLLEQNTDTVIEHVRLRHIGGMGLVGNLCHNITANDFSMYPDEETVIISARSIGSANVQVILEALGGGGNAATAGAQIKNSTVKDVLDRLVASIDSFYEQ